NFVAQRAPGVGPEHHPGGIRGIDEVVHDDQFTFAPDLITRSAHFLISRSSNFARSLVSSPPGSTPCDFSLAISSGSASAVLAAVCSFFRAASGVPAGAYIMNQATRSKSLP